MKLAFIDLDGVIADSTARFDHAEFVATMRYTKSTQSKLWTDLYWRTVFHPDHLVLDTVIDGVRDALTQLEEDYDSVIFLTSRPESMRAATVAWLEQHLEVHTRELLLIMKPSAFQYVKTVTWKAGTIHQLAAYYSATDVLVVDDEQANLDEVTRHDAPYKLLCFTNLKREVEPEPPFDEDFPF